VEAIQAVLKELYTSFLLRDFAGKIVPGCFLFGSIAVLFANPQDVLKAFSSRISLVAIALSAGLAWIVVLGLQSIAEFSGVWNYYPRTQGAEMEIQVTIIDEFLRIACPDQRQQYERFVVIKEATGNLFIAGVLSMPAWALWFGAISSSPATRPILWGQWQTNVRTLVALLYAAVILLGLYSMNLQHVRKQFEFARDILAKVDKTAPRDCNPGTPAHATPAK
jgi:hypothetical protein